MSTILEPPASLPERRASPPTQRLRQLTIALAGNPNAGKTSLFNALTGLRQRVANYPGVTVERKEGQWALDVAGAAARLVDLPGLYSLDAESLDEQIARDVLTGRMHGMARPDLILAVVDATNLARNLYLVRQLMEMDRPLVIALTMMDLAERRGISIDVEKLSRALGVEVVPVVARQRRGLEMLARAVLKAQTSEHASSSTPFNLSAAPEAVKQGSAPESWQDSLLDRYRWIEGVVAEATGEGGEEQRRSTTDRIDNLVTHKFYGPLILLFVMLLVFQAIFSWANVPMNLIDEGCGALGQLVRGSLPAGLLTDLLVNGVIAGVGGVLVFLPQILLLFFFISILEDSGYMARAAFLMDRLMRGVGLHGKAFMPLLSSFACAIPGIMATRTIENPKDRLATIMIAPFMSCSARLPVYTLMIATFFSDRKLFGWLSVGVLVILAMYLLGISVAIAVAFVLKRTLLKGPPPPLIMELPPYRLPNPVNIAHTMRMRAGLFVRRAGTVILAISILLWALVTFPRAGVKGVGVEAASEQIQQSLAGRVGHLLEPVIAPLGFDWKIGIGLISSFAARETLVSTLSIVYNVAPDAEEDSRSLVEAVREARRADGSRAWTPLVALSLMVFFVLACQCMSTVAIVRRETNSWRWPLFMVGYMLALAYTASFITYQGGRLLGFS